MSKSLIRKNQLHPDISDLVGQYGSGFFISFASSGDLINSLAEIVSGDFTNTVRTTGDQTVSGVKAFILRPTVNGTGVLLSGEAAQADLSSTVRTTGNQTISGVKTFASRPTVNGTGVLLIGEGAGGGDYNYFTTSITLGNSYINLANSTSGITATLPSIASGRNYIVKNLNTGTLTVTGLNSIDGNVNLKLHKKESAHLLGVNNVGFTGWVSLNTNPGIS
jgi:hypothetical protein